MKTTFKLWGIVALVALVAMIGLGVIACKDEPGDTAIHVTGVELSVKEILRVPGQERRISASVSPDNASNKAITWSSSDSSKVSVTPIAGSTTDAMIEAKAVGVVTITVTTADGGKTDTCVVTVKSATDAAKEVNEKEEKDRWGTSQDQKSTATITGEYDESSDAYKVTVSGTAEQEDYMAHPSYQYVADAEAESYYSYTFKAWTQSGTRTFRAAPVPYSGGFIFEITDTKTEFTFASNEKLAPGIYEMEFWCANAIGTFFISDVEVEAITDDKKAEIDKEYFENMPLTARWSSYTDDGSKAKLSHSVDNEGVVTITVTGSPEQHSNGVWNAWKAAAEYLYLSEQGKAYAYKFEAWTKDGEERTIRPQYYKDNDDEVYLGAEFDITDTKTEYTVYGDELPKGGMRPLGFHSADTIGTYYVKIISIEEYAPRKLTITGIPAGYNWLNDAWICGECELRNFTDPEDENDVEWFSFQYIASSPRGNFDKSVTLSLLTSVDWGEFDGPWEGTGSYNIIIGIYGEEPGGRYIYTDGAEFSMDDIDDYKYDFANTDPVTIEFSKFKPLPYLQLSYSSFD